MPARNERIAQTDVRLLAPPDRRNFSIVKRKDAPFIRTGNDDKLLSHDRLRENGLAHVARWARIKCLSAFVGKTKVGVFLAIHTRLSSHSRTRKRLGLATSYKLPE